MAVNRGPADQYLHRLHPCAVLAFFGFAAKCVPIRRTQRLQEVQRVQGEDGDPRGATSGHRRQQTGLGDWQQTARFVTYNYILFFVR